jgi:hypothetical protein
MPHRLPPSLSQCVSRCASVSPRKPRAGTREEIVSCAKALCARARASLPHAFDRRPPRGAVPLAGFVQTGVLSSALAGVSENTSSGRIAKRKARDADTHIGLGSRVKYVYETGAGPLAARARDPDEWSGGVLDEQVSSTDMRMRTHIY